MNEIQFGCLTTHVSSASDTAHGLNTDDSAYDRRAEDDIPVMDHRIMLASESVSSACQTEPTLHLSGTKAVLSKERH